MPTEPIRFIHAASLLVDAPLQQTGPVPAEWREAVCDASRRALDAVLDACVKHEVDALLLVGDNFCADSVGISGQTRLARALDRLAEKNIPVFIVPGERDPWSAWLPGLRFGDHVCRLGYDCDAAVPLSRDDQPLAMIYGARGNFTTGRNGFDLPRIEQLRVSEVDREVPFRIALTAGDLPEHSVPQMTYWALGGPGERTTRALGNGIAHHPGSVQGRTFDEAGPRGCSLVQIDEHGAVHTELIPTAPVRYERLETQLPAGTAYTELQQALIVELQKKSRHATDRLWLLDWQSGNAPQADDRELTTSELHELIGELPALAGLLDVGLFLAQVRCTANTELPHDADPLQVEFVTALQQRFTTEGTSLRDCLNGSELRASIWEQRMSTGASCDSSGINERANAAHQTGLRWLAAQEGTASS